MPRTIAESAPERAAVLTRSTLRAASRLGLSRIQLAATLGLSLSTISRLRADQTKLRANSKSWELATLLVRLYLGLDTILAGDERSLQAWMHQPNTDLRSVPADLIANEGGLVHTMAYVETMRERC